MTTGRQQAEMYEGMWRFGKLLICHRDVYFPDRCVKSNDPVGSSRVKLKLKWHHPFLFLLAGSHAFAKVSAAQTSTITLRVGLCRRCRQRIKRIQLTVMVWLAVSLVAMLIGLLSKTSFSAELLIVGGLGLVLGFVVDRFFGRTLVVKEINSRYVWLRGVCQEFLAELPEWPREKSH